jgi:ribosomal protein S18 acetylase RimI-like enzyme
MYKNNMGRHPMKVPSGFEIQVVKEHDRAWMREIIKTHWGDEFVVVHEEVFFPHQLPGFIVRDLGTDAVGLVTYQIRGDVCEILTLNSLIENRGVGSMLLEAVIEEAEKLECSQLCLTTTNDNQRAIEFYRNKGFILREICKAAVDRAREIKPSIPALSPQGIPICDEWEFVLDLPRKE